MPPARTGIARERALTTERPAAAHLGRAPRHALHRAACRAAGLSRPSCAAYRPLACPRARAAALRGCGGVLNAAAIVDDTAWPCRRPASELPASSPAGSTCGSGMRNSKWARCGCRGQPASPPARPLARGDAGAERSTIATAGPAGLNPHIRSPGPSSSWCRPPAPVRIRYADRHANRHVRYRVLLHFAA